MATAHIELPYDRESHLTPWAPACRITAEVRALGYGAERHVYPGSRRELLRLTADEGLRT